MFSPFFKPKLLGDRFAHHQVPLEIFKDFSAFEEMLIEVAKQEYLKDNPGRQRTPRGFTKRIEVRLAAIEEGSAVLSFTLAGLSLLPTESQYIEKAHVKIINTIANITKGDQPELPPDLLRYFDRFGRSLLPGESIEFSRLEGEAVRLTPEVRLQLLRASQAEEWTEEATLKGRISATDQSDKEFELELRDGTKLKAPLEKQHNSNVIEALSGYDNGRILAVKGIIKRDRLGVPKSFESVEHVNPLDPLDIELRLEDLAKLKDGWLNGRGVAGDAESLKTLAEKFDRFFDSELALPHLYPTPEGGVLAEWSLGNWAVSLTIQMPTYKAQYQALDLVTGKCLEEDLDLHEVEADWTNLNDALRALSPRPA